MASQLRVDKILPVDGAPTNGGGGIVQVVSVTKTDTFTATSTSTAQDVTGLTVNITPKFSTSKLLIMVHVATTAGSDWGAQALLLAKVVGGTTSYPFRGNASGSATRGTFPVTGSGANNGYPDLLSGSFLDTAGSTNQITYKIQHIDENTNNAIYINRETYGDSSLGQTVSTSGITIMEVSA